MLTSRAWFKAVVELRHDYTDEIVDANGVGLAQKKSAAQLGSHFVNATPVTYIVITSKYTDMPKFQF